MFEPIYNIQPSPPGFSKGTQSDADFLLPRLTELLDRSEKRERRGVTHYKFDGLEGDWRFKARKEPSGLVTASIYEGPKLMIRARLVFTPHGGGHA